MPLAVGNNLNWNVRRPSLWTWLDAGGTASGTMPFVRQSTFTTGLDFMSHVILILSLTRCFTSDMELLTRVNIVANSPVVLDQPQIQAPPPTANLSRLAFSSPLAHCLPPTGGIVSQTV